MTGTLHIERPTSIPARWVLDAIEPWATGAYMIRETELLTEKDCNGGKTGGSLGRVDSLLVPFKPWETPWASKIGGWAWNVARLVGVEVKVSRSDFKKGLDTKQYDRYAGGLAALYVATPKGLIKTKELPEHLGHLEIFRTPETHTYRCVCKRHARFEDRHVAPQMMWKLLSMITDAHHARERELELQWSKAREVIGRRAAQMIARALEPVGESL